MDPVYLDYAATTPVRDEVRAAMAPFDRERFGNPSSLHRWGRAAAEGLESARAEVAEALGAAPDEIHFVRGGTESDNLATVGACAALAEDGGPPTLLVSAVEHPAVLEAAEWAERSGVAERVVLPVRADGSVEREPLDAALAGGRCVASVMWVNNETGMILPVPALAEAVRAAGAVMHSDASQAVGKVEIDLRVVPVDLLTATGHKIYGPKGTGILFVRRGTRVAPLLHGGGQERAVRPGTEDVAGAVGFATALRLALAARESEAERMSGLRTRLECSLLERLTGTRVNAGDAPRAAHVSSIGFTDLSDGPALLMALDLEGIAVSGGSACASGSQKGSHVIAALYGDDDAHTNVRYSFGLGTEPAHVERAVEATVRAVERLRSAA